VRGGLATSVVLHAAMLGWALITIPSQRELRMAEPEPIAVDLVNASELTRLRQGVRTAKQMEAQPKESKAEPAKKEAPKPTPAAAAPPPPPPPEPEAPKEEPKKEAAVPPPPPAPAAAPPVPSPEDQKKFEEMLKEQQQVEERKKAEEQRRLEEERKAAELKKQEDARKRAAELKKKRDEEKRRKEAEARKKQFDAEKIAALLNKTQDKGGPRPSAPLDEQAKAKGPVLGAPEGRDRQISASELAILAQIIRSCVQSKWNVLGGGEGAQHTIVKLRLRFNPDGTLAGAPVVMNPQSTPTFLAISDSAIRAAEACQPYSLPPAKYETWKDIVLNFDPREMF
jgi:colicin import membrane protein